MPFFMKLVIKFTIFIFFTFSQFKFHSFYSILNQDLIFFTVILISQIQAYKLVIKIKCTYFINYLVTNILVFILCKQIKGE